MLFDFKETYTAYSNEALIAIIAHPDSYQPEAVDAARTILAERGLTAAELQAAMNPPQQNTIVNNDAITYDDGHTNIFEELEKRPVTLPTKRRIALVYVLTGLYGLKSLWRFYDNFLVYLTMERLRSLSFIRLLIMSVDFIIPALIIVLLYRKKRTGWILGISYFVISLFNTIYNLFYFNFYTLWQVLYWGLQIAGHVIILIQLYRSEIRHIYRIEQKQIVLSLLISIVFLAWLAYFIL